MCKGLIFKILILSLPLSGCAVHQWPEPNGENGGEWPDTEFVLRLKFHPDMTVWEHNYDLATQEVTPVGTDDPETYDNTQAGGFIRYLVRIYPQAASRSEQVLYQEEYEFTGTTGPEGYDFETTLALPAGDYTLLAWADIRATEDETPAYDATDFGELTLTAHTTNSDWRDAFRGAKNITLLPAAGTRAPETLEVEMHRPLAKFEIVAEGLEEFLRQHGASAAEDYTVVMASTGYTPFVYSIPGDLPVDSRYAEQFPTGIRPIDDGSASLGFDYIFVKAEESSTRVRIGVFDAAGREIVLTEPIFVPLQRDRHTVIRGRFFDAHASGGGIGVDPDFAGDFNIIK